MLKLNQHFSQYSRDASYSYSSLQPNNITRTRKRGIISPSINCPYQKCIKGQKTHNLYPRLVYQSYANDIRTKRANNTSHTAHSWFAVSRDQDEKRPAHNNLSRGTNIDRINTIADQLIKSRHRHRETNTNTPITQRNQM